jgi:SAM-dependent methyltransferase
MELSMVDGPFGPARRVSTLPVQIVADMYIAKCGFDPRPHFAGIDVLELFECESTGYRYWRPAEAAGDETFYRQLSAVWPTYYRDWRWEYGPTLSLLRPTDALLEIGCGRGFFLRNTEGLVRRAVGLEFNQEAICAKATKYPIVASSIEDFSRAAREEFNFVCSFQVLEHVTNPQAFIRASMECLKKGGLLAFSTPNACNKTFASRGDAFDLPPHHMGQFSPAVYRLIAKRFGLKIRLMLCEPRFVDVHNKAQLGERSFAKGILNPLHRWLYGPGPTILAVFAKL